MQEAIEESFRELHPWMAWAVQLQSLEETRVFLERAQETFSSGDDFGVLGFLKETGQFVLASGVHPKGWEVPKFEIGYWCRTSQQGRGLATEVVRALTAASFLEMGAQRVEIRCDARNHGSRRVAELAGFRLEAILRNDARANDGSLRNTCVYALLPNQFHSEE